VFVAALPADSTPEDVVADFIRTFHKHPRFSWSRVPSAMAWVAAAPTGQTFFLCRWVNWDKHTVALFREFCAKSGRACGLLAPDQTIDLGSRKISFFDCRLIHEDDIKPKQRTTRQTTAAGRDVVATARKLLRARKAACEELEHEGFRNDRAAHDDSLHEQLRRKFVRRLKAFEKKLAAQFGSPAETGADDQGRVTLNGVFRYAIWNVSARQLFLAAHHEDRELPYAIVLGTIAGETA
jgi:hypothetical protein